MQALLYKCKKSQIFIARFLFPIPTLSVKTDSDGKSLEQGQKQISSGVRL